MQVSHNTKPGSDACPGCCDGDPAEGTLCGNCRPDTEEDRIFNGPSALVSLDEDSIK